MSYIVKTNELVETSGETLYWRMQSTAE